MGIVREVRAEKGGNDATGTCVVTVEESRCNPVESGCFYTLASGRLEG